MRATSSSRFARAAVAVLILALMMLTETSAVAAPTSTPTIAYPAPGLLEGSGLAASVRHPGVIWVMEDSGDPVVHGYDPTGAEVATVTMLPTGSDDTWGGDIRDAEALAMGPGPTLWVADIGDNNAVRESVVVHEVPEPADLGPTSVAVKSYRFTYPAGPRDAETYLVDPTDGRAYIVTKGLFGGGLYAAPSTLTPNATHELIFVQNTPAIISDGAFSADGAHVVLRETGFGTSSKAFIYDVRHGAPGEPIALAADPVEVELPDQTQGESVCFTPDGTALLIGSEGEDEPIWSVPLPTTAHPSDSASTASTSPPHSQASSPPTAGGAVSGAEDHTAATAVVGGIAVVLALGLIVAARRRRSANR